VARRHNGRAGRKEAEPVLSDPSFRLRLVMKPGAHTIASSCKWTSRLDARFSNLADHGASRREMEKKKVMQVRKIDVGGMGETMNGLRADTVELVASHASALDAAR
jgi:hypothetical protein